MTQQTTPITEDGYYLIKGSVVLNIMNTLNATIPCAFGNTVSSVGGMLATVRPVQMTNQPSPEESTNQALPLETRPE